MIYSTVPPMVGHSFVLSFITGSNRNKREQTSVILMLLSIFPAGGARERAEV